MHLFKGQIENLAIVGRNRWRSMVGVFFGSIIIGVLLENVAEDWTELHAKITLDDELVAALAQVELSTVVSSYADDSEILLDDDEASRVFNLNRANVATRICNSVKNSVVLNFGLDNDSVKDIRCVQSRDVEIVPYILIGLDISGENKHTAEHYRDSVVLGISDAIRHRNNELFNIYRRAYIGSLVRVIRGEGQRLNLLSSFRGAEFDSSAKNVNLALVKWILGLDGGLADYDRSIDDVEQFLVEGKRIQGNRLTSSMADLNQALDSFEMTGDIWVSDILRRHTVDPEGDKTKDLVTRKVSTFFKPSRLSEVSFIYLGMLIGSLICCVILITGKNKAKK